MFHKTTFSTYAGSGGKTDLNCWRCGGTGFYWKWGGSKPKNRPYPGCSLTDMTWQDHSLTCDCQWSSWQYHKEKK